jgi:glycine/D-amino acid oxidase-like deaminating enzyme
MSVSERDSAGWITVNTDRGVVRTRAVIHTTNRWASHLLPEFEKLILPVKGTVAAIKAPAGFIKHTGAQHWDSVVNVSSSSDSSRLYFCTDVFCRTTTYSCLLLTT